MRILGIDCGSLSTGYGVIDSDGARHHLVAAGSIDCSGKLPLPDRLERIGGRLRELIAEHRPECAAVEEVFHSVNPKSAITLAHVRGVALFVLSEARLPLGEYSPATIKSTITGFGRAEKGQVQYMVRTLLGMTETIPSPDAADALAAAVCHAVHQPAGVMR